MSASAAFAAELEALGIWWPEGDGDALRVSADGWLAAADLLEDIGRVLDVAASTVVENHRGEAAARFADLWSRWSGPAGYVAVTVADLRRVAVALQDFGTDIDVADRALVRLIEEALAAQTVPTLLLIDELWRAWLADNATLIGTELAARADRATAPLSDVERAPVLSAEERAAIDPAQVTWPDLRPPADLSHLVTTVVDLGAGQGELPVLDVPTVPPEGTEGTPPVDVPTDPGVTDLPAAPSGTGGITIVVNGDGNTITVETPSYAAPSFTPTTDAFDGLTTAPLPEPALTPDVPLDPPAFDAFAPDAFTMPPAVASAPARLAELDGVRTHDAYRSPDVPVPPTPIAVGRPGATAGVAAGAAAATAAAAAGAARSGRAPFFPFMPMGGGMTGGDEAAEPRRRVTKKRRLGG